MLFTRYYSGDEDDDKDAVISIHDDDSDPELNEEPAAKIRRVAADDSSTWDDDGCEETDGCWRRLQAVSFPAHDTLDSGKMFEKCPHLKDVPCLIVDVHPGELLYLPASWLYEVFLSDFNLGLMQPLLTCNTHYSFHLQLWKANFEATRSLVDWVTISV